MSTDRDTTRIVRSWLRTDEHESADRVLDIVIARLDTTPQRRSPWPARRIVEMNLFAKLASVAAAVLIVAVVGYNLLPAIRGVGGGPAISPSPSPTPIPSPSPTPLAFPARGELPIGRHSMTLQGVTFTFELTTTGWVSEGSFGIDKGHQTAADAAGFIFWSQTPTGVFSDPCTQTEAPLVDASAADFAAAVTTISGIDVVSGPSNVTVDGRPAVHVAISIPEGIGCTPENFYLWYSGDGPLGRYATAIDSTINVWIIDVDGAFVWIDGETYKTSSPAAGQELQQIVDSIRFE